MPSGVYKRKQKKTKENKKMSYEFAMVHMDTINLIMDLINSIKKNKIGVIK